MMSSISFAVLLLPHLILMGDTASHALQLPTDATIQTNRRRDFIIRGSIDATLCRYFLCYPYRAFAADDATTLPPPPSSDLLDAKTIYWDGPAWSTIRYGTSTLSSDKSNSNRSNVPPASVPITSYPFRFFLANPQSRKHFCSRYPHFESKIVHITNGYDEILEDSIEESLKFNFEKRKKTKE